MNPELQTYIAKRHAQITTPLAFFFLCFFTFGIYSIWWQYKAWRFIKQKDNLSVSPVARAFFAVFFVHGLLDRIDYDAREKGHQGIATGAYATAYVILAIISNILSRLPDPYWFVTIAIPFYAFLIPSVKQLNYYWETEENVALSRTMSTKAIVLLLFGILFFLLVILGLLSEAGQ
ncbi:hypothetical protein [Fibrella arboris]|uniref:hypothetical protein n=1 Tax=Fibrella arboris TaxID=3242486 RepID=UPI00352250D7